MEPETALLQGWHHIRVLVSSSEEASCVSSAVDRRASRDGSTGPSDGIRDDGFLSSAVGAVGSRNANVDLSCLRHFVVPFLGLAAR